MRSFYLVFTFFCLVWSTYVFIYVIWNFLPAKRVYTQVGGKSSAKALHPPEVAVGFHPHHIDKALVPPYEPSQTNTWAMGIGVCVGGFGQ